MCFIYFSRPVTLSLVLSNVDIIVTNLFVFKIPRRVVVFDIHFIFNIFVWSNFHKIGIFYRTKVVNNTITILHNINIPLFLS